MVAVPRMSAMAGAAGVGVITVRHVLRVDAVLLRRVLGRLVVNVVRHRSSSPPKGPRGEHTPRGYLYARVEPGRPSAIAVGGEYRS